MESVILAITNLDWYNYLSKLNPCPEKINFWTPSDWKMTKHKNKELFFKLKSRTEIAGKGVIQSYSLMSVKDAWNKYKELNGVSSLTELREKVKSNKEESRIGCIELANLEFWPEKSWRDPEKFNIDFAKNIQKYKEIQYPKNTVLVNYKTK